MKQVIALLTARQADIEADIAAFDQVIERHDTGGIIEKRKELRELSNEIQSAINMLKCQKEIELLKVLIDEGRIKDPND